MKNTYFGVIGAAALLLAASQAQAITWESTINIATDDFVVDGFSGDSTTPDASYSYELDLNNVSGRAEFDIPPSGNLRWFANGTVEADTSNPNLNPILINLTNQLIYSGFWPSSSFTNKQFLFDFDNEIYDPSSAGSFAVPYQGLSAFVQAFRDALGLGTGPILPDSGILSVDYLIGDIDPVGGMNDIRMSITEIPGTLGLFGTDNYTFAGLLDVLDSQFGNDDGRIDGTLGVAMTLTAVPEPATIALFSLGLVGFATRRRR